MSSHILVVEDESIVAMDIESSLKGLGYEATVANSSEEALQQVEAKRPDLVLMDIQLGDGPDGIETATQIRQRYGIPSVYLTANADDDTIQRARRAEPAGYILKPFRERELHATVQMALSRISIGERLKERDDWHTAILHSMNDPVVTVSKDCAVVFMNQAAEEAAGCAAGEGIGKDCASLLPFVQGKRGEFARRLAQALQEGVALRIADLALDSGEELGRVMTGDSIAPMVSADGEVTGAVVVFRAPASRKPAAAVQGASGAGRADRMRLASIVAKSGNDPLTGLPGRTLAERALSQAIHRRARAFAALISVDRFETIQNRFGQGAADEVLLFMSLHLAQDLAVGDRLFRWSGPNFLVLMERLDAIEDVRREIAHLTSMKLEKLLHLKARSALVVVTAHWSVLPAFMGDSAEELVVRIDRSLAPDTPSEGR